MTVQDTLKRALLLYPSLYSSRWDVYHQWFITNGNGMSWMDGELVDHVKDEENSVPTMQEVVEKHFEFYCSKERLFNSSLSFSIERVKESILSIFDWEQRANKFTPDEKTPRKNIIYPLCEFARIFHVPANVKPDWLEAVTEMHQWLKDNYSKLTEQDQKYVDKIIIPNPATGEE